MRMKDWTSFEKYIVMSDRSGKIKLGYEAFHEFKKVKEALMKISNCYTQTYQFGIDVYDKKITSIQAKTALENIEKCTYSTAIKIVANQIGARI
tara:strand:- start:1032 stop:1313 length:282 start_codon:yes stop_codon:yes gene_type:complete